MAARKNYRLKLKYASRLRQLSDFTADVEDSPKELVKELIMASVSEHNGQSPPRSAPDSMPSPYDFGNPSALPSQQPLSHPVPPITASSASQRRRKTPKHSLSSLKRSASTPNVRGDAGMSMADKRRNKLGYHRTSVACGHCRRRKIRCLLAPDDPQNRCSNCIRLKKDCNFFPVDQQPQVERRPRTTSRAGTGDLSGSSSSSPAMTSHPDDQLDHFYPPLPLNHEFPACTSAMNGNVISPSGRVHHRPFEFSHVPDRSHWESPFYEHGSLSAGPATPEDPAQAYWKMAESPVTPGFSPHFSGPPSSVPHHARESVTSFSALPTTRDEPGWSMHPRSLSFGRNDEAAVGYQSHYPSPHQIEFRRRTSDMHHPPSLQTSGNSSTTSVSEAHTNTPLSAPPMTSQPMHPYSVSPTWSAISSHTLAGKGSEYGSWYPEPPSLAKVQEEDGASHYSADPAIVFVGGHQ